jgi:hypothetical protein
VWQHEDWIDLTQEKELAVIYCDKVMNFWFHKGGKSINSVAINFTASISLQVVNVH